MDTSVTYTLEQCITHIGFGRFHWRFVIILGFYLMTESMELMLLSILGPALQCYWPDVTDFQIASLTSCVFVGMMFGSFCFGILADKYGRRIITLINTVLLALFGVLTALSPSYNWILVSRTVVGAAVAGQNPLFTLAMEYLPSTTRASSYVYAQIFWSVGCIYVYLLSMFVIPLYGWRVLALLCALPALLMIVFIYFIPESARYYVASGQPEKAEEALKKIASINNRSLPEGKLVDIQAEEECGSVKQLFNAKFRKTTLLMTHMWIASCFGYYGIVLINTTMLTLYGGHNSSTIELNTTNSTKCKMLTTDDYISLILTTFGEMLGIPILMFLITYFDRRTISIIQYSFGTLCFAIFLFIAPYNLTMINIVTFFSRMFLNSQFIFLYIYTMEVYPTVIRSAAVGYGSAIARIGAILAPYMAQALIKPAYSLTIGIFVTVTGLAALCAYLLPYETRGQGLKQATVDTVLSSEASDHLVGLPQTRSLNNDGLVNNGYESVAVGRRSNGVTE